MKRANLGLGTAMFFVIAVSVAAADRPRIEFAGTYSLLQLNDDAGTFPLGWTGTVAIEANNWFAIVGEIGGDYKTYVTPPGSPGPWRGHNETFLGGPRFAMTISPAVNVFGQVLLGAQYSGTRTPRFDLSVTRFAWQPGVGLDLSISTRWAVRFQGDYRPRDPTQERLAAALYTSEIRMSRPRQQIGSNRCSR